MHANSLSGQPTFSDTPLLQSGTPAGSLFKSVASTPPQKTRVHLAAGHHDQLRSTITQLLASGFALPLAALLLLLLNHHSTLWKLVQGLGFIDCIALSCLAVSAVVAAPPLMQKTFEALKTVRAAVVRLPEMADNIVIMSSTVELVQQHPSPRHWLDMYYNMVSDIDNLLQEMVLLRKLMSDMHSDVEHVKDKTAWMRLHKDKK
ncbi:hypothetical protein ABBQ32_005507 [Trebouxia sp. C0010 RCD-2024]